MFLGRLGQSLKQCLNTNNQKHLKTDSNKSFGSWGEKQVCNFLEQKGFKVLKTNYRKRASEIDIIVQKNNLVCFVEVKSRRKRYFNNSEVITYSKKKKIILGAKHFISENKLVDCAYRFDVAILEGAQNSFEINYIKNAFSESDFCHF